MESGKLNWEDLTRIINKNTINRKEVKVSSSIGEDCAILNFNDDDIIISTDPITGASENIGKLAININVNDIASNGAEPVGIMLTLLFPEGTSIEEIEKLNDEIVCECSKFNIQVLGGHTEVTAAVNQPIVSCTILGKAPKGKSVVSKGAKVGDDILVTKYLALEGTNILINDYKNKLSNILSKDEIIKGEELIDSISVLKEGRIAAKFGVSSMHDITEGGLLGAVWEIAEAAKVGFVIDNDALPILDITKKVCNYFSIDPLRLISSGSMLITCKNGEDLIKELEANNIKATIVGKIEESKKFIRRNGKLEEVEKPERDELFKINIE